RAGRRLINDVGHGPAGGPLVDVLKRIGRLRIVQNHLARSSIAIHEQTGLGIHLRVFNRHFEGWFYEESFYLGRAIKLAAYEFGHRFLFFLGHAVPIHGVSRCVTLRGCVYWGAHKAAERRLSPFGSLRRGRLRFVRVLGTAYSFLPLSLRHRRRLTALNLLAVQSHRAQSLPITGGFSCFPNSLEIR